MAKFLMIISVLTPFLMFANQPYAKPNSSTSHPSIEWNELISQHPYDRDKLKEPEALVSQEEAIALLKPNPAQKNASIVEEKTLSRSKRREPSRPQVTQRDEQEESQSSKALSRRRYGSKSSRALQSPIVQNREESINTPAKKSPKAKRKTRPHYSGKRRS